MTSQDLPPIDGASDATYRFAHDLLGPAMLPYFARLDSTIRHFATRRDARVLFVSRAGVRIRRLYAHYLTAAGRTEPEGCDDFWISRFMCVKGIWSRAPEVALRLLNAEFPHATLRDVFSAVFHASHFAEDVDLTDASFDAPASGFAAAIWGQSDAAYYARWHLTDQAGYFERYLDQVLGGRRRALMIDSGWQGTAHTLLADHFPAADWWSAFVGRSFLPNGDRRHAGQMMGLVFESDVFVPGQPETAIVHHRHLIEHLFEPRGPSIECLTSENGRIIAPQSALVLADAPTPQDDPLFCGVRDYLAGLGGLPQRPVMLAEARAAWCDIARIIVFPDRAEAQALSQMRRSADFGRDLLAPLLLPTSPRHEWDSAEQRITEALWPAGQVALELPPEIALPRQQQLLGGKIKPGDILRGKTLPAPSKRPAAALAAPAIAGTGDVPAVALITRTLDRPLFLRRALESVAQQTMGDYVHVVVSDGGDIDLVRHTIETSPCDKRKVMLVDNVTNRGMEAASNIGIGRSRSEFIVIHDDDDTLEPRFLEVMAGYLRGNDGARYGGALSRTTYVSEEVMPDGIKICETKPYNDWIVNVQLMEMACGNFFAPIAFLFRRSICEAIGGFDPSLPVLGDWDFNLRFLARADIGVVPQALANYHHRDRGNVGLFANSLVGSVARHAEYNAVVRNRMARKLADDGLGAIGTLVALGLTLTDIRDTARRGVGEIGQARAELRQMAARPADGLVQDAALRAFQDVADERWLALAALEQRRQREVAALASEIAQLRARLAQGEAAMAALRDVADERWVALCDLETRRRAAL